jgi:hypothetical protein
LNDNEINIQVNDLWKRYTKGLNSKFHQFENNLLALEYAKDKKLKMILCHSVIEYYSDDKILKDLGLDPIKKQYHIECDKLVRENFERTQKKDQIVRVGENLIVDVINGKVKYDHFSVYVGIISFLGRRYKAKRISNEIIAYRAIGYKNFTDWFDSESTQKPLSRYKINKAVEYLEDAGYLRTFSLKIGQMKYYSTRLETKKELAEFVTNREKVKLRKKFREEKLREQALKEIQAEEEEYERLRQSNALYRPFYH